MHEIYELAAEDAGLAFKAHIQPDVAVTGDGELLTQLFVNLVENAIRFVPRGSKIALMPHGSPHGVRVIVSDIGPGIAAHERDKVFRRLCCGEQSRTSAGNGLSLADAISGLHQAKVTLHDSAPGLRVEFVMEQAQ